MFMPVANTEKKVMIKTYWRGVKFENIVLHSVVHKK